MVEDKKKAVECACNHLTNFAILMQVKTFEVSLKNIFLFYFCKKRLFLRCVALKKRSRVDMKMTFLPSHARIDQPSLVLVSYCLVPFVVQKQ